MGTRSTVKFYSEHTGKPLLCVFQMFDGYISGVGHDLASFLKDKKVINGITSGCSMENGYANGMACLAAQYVKYGKETIGGFYIDDIDSTAEYDYHVRLNKSKIEIAVGDFKGTPEELLALKE